jgi:[acyl-carrier-protein] S-malonyltransferase
VSQKRRVGLLFPGQGAQYIGMGKDLYENYPEAKAVFDLAASILDFDILNMCFNGPQEDLQRTRYAQSAIFIVSMAAFAVFKSEYKGYADTEFFAAGLSLGEATALTTAGAFDLKTGIEFVRDRGLYMDEASEIEPGSMAAVMGLDLEKVEMQCELSGAEVGNLNCPGQVVISGKKDAVIKASELCVKAGARRVMPLQVSGAFHSECMNSACEKIETLLNRVEIHPPNFTVVSNLTAQPESEVGDIKQNLVKQMNHRTLWQDSMRYFLDAGVMEYYEIGPGKVLKGLMRKIDPEANVQPLGTADDFKSFNLETSNATKK